MRFAYAWVDSRSVEEDSGTRRITRGIVRELKAKPNSAHARFVLRHLARQAASNTHPHIRPLVLMTADHPMNSRLPR